MYNSARGLLIQKIWDNFKGNADDIVAFFSDNEFYFDHLAIIDLPSKYSGIPFMRELLSLIGFEQRGSGFLPDKNNDFIWVTAEDACSKTAYEALPQIVLADYRLDDFSLVNRDILYKYANKITEEDLFLLRSLKAKKNSRSISSEDLVNQLSKILLKRAWPMPTVNEFNSVKEENQLAAWTLVFGRKVNHFGLNINLLNKYASLQSFNGALKKQLNEPLNTISGEIKGSKCCGIEQSSSLGKLVQIELSDGVIEVNNSFMEFVWRFSSKENPTMWNDYYTDFIAVNANNVIESLYQKAA